MEFKVSFYLFLVSFEPDNILNQRNRGFSFQDQQLGVILVEYRYTTSQFQTRYFQARYGMVCSHSPNNMKQNARVVPIIGRYLKLFADEIALLSPSVFTALHM